jgi:hypothetical protein
MKLFGFEQKNNGNKKACHAYVSKIPVTTYKSFSHNTEHVKS